METVCGNRNFVMCIEVAGFSRRFFCPLPHLYVFLSFCAKYSMITHIKCGLVKIPSIPTSAYRRGENGTTPIKTESRSHHMDARASRAVPSVSHYFRKGVLWMPYDLPLCVTLSKCDRSELQQTLHLGERVPPVDVTDADGWVNNWYGLCVKSVKAKNCIFSVVQIIHFKSQWRKCWWIDVDSNENVVIGMDSLADSSYILSNTLWCILANKKLWKIILDTSNQSHNIFFINDLSF